jgi:tRNA A37 methylthiotransferase MiaB
MDGQIDKAVKKDRVSRLSRVGEGIRAELLAEAVRHVKEALVLFEDYKDGYAYGHTDNFIEVRVKSPVSLHSEFHRVRFINADGGIINAELA